MQRNNLLVSAGYLSFFAALLHVSCIFGGPSWYRFFGAGEHMAQMAANGDLYLHQDVFSRHYRYLLGAWGHWLNRSFSYHKSPYSPKFNDVLDGKFHYMLHLRYLLFIRYSALMATEFIADYNHLGSRSFEQIYSATVNLSSTPQNGS